MLFHSFWEWMHIEDRPADHAPNLAIARAPGYRTISDQAEATRMTEVAALVTAWEVR